MFINVVYKDGAELSLANRRPSTEPDPAEEKILLVNPNCPVRIMLEYIRKQCKLGTFTAFDLCDESGALMGLFNLETYAYATSQFVHKRTYYVIVLLKENNKVQSVIPQLNQDNKFYAELKQRVMTFLLTSISPSPSKTSQSMRTLPVVKTSPTKATKKK